MHEISCAQNCFTCTDVHVKEWTCTLLIITWYDCRNCTKLVLKPLAVKNGLSFSAVYCSFPVDYTISIYMMNTLHFCSLYTTRSIYIAAIPFLINWKQWSKSNILTMDHNLVLESSSSTAIYTLLNTIIFLKTIKYLNIRLKQIY